MAASTVDLLQDAARLHHQGAQGEAAGRDRQVLERDPDHAQALRRPAVICCRRFCNPNPRRPRKRRGC